MSLWSQLDRVIGLQFVSLLRSFPALGISFNNESLWDGASTFLTRLWFQASTRMGPKVDHSKPIME